MTCLKNPLLGCINGLFFLAYIYALLRSISFCIMQAKARVADLLTPARQTITTAPLSMI